MANTSPIDTQTQVKRVTLSGNITKAIQEQCDAMGAAGYALCGCFASAGELILIFQLTR